jgi:hypothetical protein
MYKISIPISIWIDADNHPKIVYATVFPYQYTNEKLEIELNYAVEAYSAHVGRVPRIKRIDKALECELGSLTLEE